MQILRILTALVLAGTANAADWYVDAVHGNDANSGMRPGNAWRTISHANAQLSGGVLVTIHIAPGTYDAALGESFPIVIHGYQDKQQYVGDAGAASTLVDAGGAGTAFQLVSDTQLVSSDTRIQGLSIRNAGAGIRVTLAGHSCEPVLSELDVSACSTGVSASASSSNDTLDVWLERSRVHDCAEGLAIGNSPPSVARLRIVDSLVDHHTTHGVLAGRGTIVFLSRSRLQHNGTHGLVTDDQGFANVSCRLEDCEVTDNGANGLEFSGGLPWTGTTALVWRCTIADNLGVGVQAGGAYNDATLKQCILFGNGDDVAPNGGTSAAYCDIGDGDFAGTNGNISANPLFRAPAAGDYRLVWGSPCIEAGDPLASAGTLDLLGVARPVDGDLDALERDDIGAHEFTPLQLAGPVHIGSSALFELWGPGGGRAILYVSRGAPQPTPLATFFGDFDLDPLAYRNLGTSRVQPGPPAHRQLPIPNDPLYIGQTFSFQALASSSVPSPTAAYTNPVTFTVLP